MSSGATSSGAQMSREADMMTQRNTGNERWQRICCSDRVKDKTTGSCHRGGRRSGRQELFFCAIGRGAHLVLARRCTPWPTVNRAGASCSIPVGGPWPDFCPNDRDGVFCNFIINRFGYIILKINGRCDLPFTLIIQRHYYCERRTVTRCYAGN
jgi:hypothetical protein